MNRVIVSIISEQTIPNYLFIKEKFQKDDKLLFISSKKMEDKINYITKALTDIDCNNIKSIILSDEENYKAMKEEIQEGILKENKYLVNLTGGTKLISLIIEKVFEQYKSEFFYIPYPKNIIINIQKNEKDEKDEIKYKIRIEEYTKLYNIKIYNSKDIFQNKEFTSKFFEKFNDKTFNEKFINTFNSLREYRNKKYINIQEIDNKINDETPKIKELLNEVEIPLKNKGQINKNEIKYLTGGWFEEYIYNYIKDNIRIDDIKLGVVIKKDEKNNEQQNDLDVVFTYGNKLFVIECKTCIIKQENKKEDKQQNKESESLFNEIVHKANSIKTALLGLSAQSYIINCGTLGENNKNIYNTTKNMNVKYFNYKDLINNDKPIITDIKKIANNVN